VIKKEVTFQTITPLYTGGVDMKMTEIKPASIMGSLRFWFDVICHFSGKFNGPKYSQTEFNYKKYQDFIESKPEVTDVEICEHLQLSPTARYFGCTGWKSKIGIETINSSKDEIRWIPPSKRKIVDGKNWYLPEKYFEGKFTISFSTEGTEIAENILFPLLNFIQEYGFLGAKNNIGFGRVKMVNSDFSLYKLLHIGESIYNPHEIVEVTNDKNLLKRDDVRKIIYFSVTKKNSVYLGEIKNLLIEKSQLRSSEIRDRSKRHFIFGSIQKDNYKEVIGPNATKIIPFISENEIGFLGIPAIISMPEVKHD